VSAGRPPPNPFWVLGLPATASRVELERAGQRLLAQLAVGARSARWTETPGGPLERDEALVRDALARLRDPEARLIAELLYAAAELLSAVPAPPAATPAAPPDATPAAPPDATPAAPPAAPEPAGLTGLHEALGLLPS
jgi:hypothetical protein